MEPAIRVSARAAGRFGQGRCRRERSDAIRPCSAGGSPLPSPFRLASTKAACPTSRGATRCARVGAKRLFRRATTRRILPRGAAAEPVWTPDLNRTPSFVSSGGGFRPGDLEHSARQGYSWSDGRRLHSTLNRSGTCGIAILLTRMPLRGRRGGLPRQRVRSPAENAGVSGRARAKATRSGSPDGPPVHGFRTLLDDHSGKSPVQLPRPATAQSC